jgi:hypothetical protein
MVFSSTAEQDTDCTAYSAFPLHVYVLDPRIMADTPLDGLSVCCQKLCTAKSTLRRPRSTLTSRERPWTAPGVHANPHVHGGVSRAPSKLLSSICLNARSLLPAHTTSAVRRRIGRLFLSVLPSLPALTRVGCPAKALSTISQNDSMRD